MARPLSIGHRGASGHEYENTRAAFRRAKALGGEGVELDIHATRDGAIVVHHEPVLEGLGRIGDLSLDAVHQHHLPNGETVPLLSEVLTLLRGMDVWIEVKGIEEYLDAVLLRSLHTGPEPERYAVHSFDHRIVRRLGERDGALRRGVLLDARLIDPLPVLAAAGATVLWQNHVMVDKGLVDEIHRAGRRIIAWTANSDADLTRLITTGVDGICTDYPERVVALRS